jgi:hypothetical protein
LLAFATTKHAEAAGEEPMCRGRGFGSTRLATTSLHDEPDEDRQCGEWVDRQEPVFPTWAAERGAEGAATIVYSIGGDGAVSDARVASEIPAHSRWGEQAIDSMRDWKRDVPADAPPECRAPRATSFAFIILC